MTRAFYIPFQHHRNVYSSYVLLRNRHEPLAHLNAERKKRFETHALKDKYVRKQRKKRLMQEELARLTEAATEDHAAPLWPDVVDASTATQGDGVVVTKAGRSGWWNRQIVAKAQ